MAIAENSPSDGFVVHFGMGLVDPYGLAEQDIRPATRPLFFYHNQFLRCLYHSVSQTYTLPSIVHLSLLNIHLFSAI